jgi:hypothetical protein
MSKYQPLGDFLRRQKADVVTMTFSQVEKVLGFELPASQNNPAWWSNNADNNVMTKVWLDAGFRVRNVRLNERELTFYRMTQPSRAVVEENNDDTVRLSELSPLALNALSVLARRSGRSLAKEALVLLSEALELRPAR